MGVGFINKNSKTLSIELRVYHGICLPGFRFVDPVSNREVARASDQIPTKPAHIPDDVLFTHLTKSLLTRLNACCLSLARLLRNWARRLRDLVR